MRQDELIIYAVTLGLCLFGLWFALFDRRRQRTARESSSWPTVTAIITSAGITTAQRDFGGESSNPQTVYQPHVGYAYDVAGTCYTGRRLSFNDDETSTLKQAQALLAPFPRGAAVPVHYDPANPGVATLRAGNSAAVFKLEYVGWFLCGFAALMTVWMVYRFHFER